MHPRPNLGGTLRARAGHRRHETHDAHEGLHRVFPLDDGVEEARKNVGGGGGQVGSLRVNLGEQPAQRRQRRLPGRVLLLLLQPQPLLLLLPLALKLGVRLEQAVALPVLERRPFALHLLRRGRGNDGGERLSNRRVLEHVRNRPANHQVHEVEVTPPGRVRVVLERAGAKHRARRGQSPGVRGDRSGHVGVFPAQIQPRQRARQSAKLQDADRHLRHALLLFVVRGLVPARPARADGRVVWAHHSRADDAAAAAKTAAAKTAKRSRRRRRRPARDRERRPVRRARLLLLLLLLLPRLLLPRLLPPVEPERALVPLALLRVEKRVVSQRSKRINLDGRGPAGALVRVVHSLLQRRERGIDHLRVRFGAVRTADRTARGDGGDRGEGDDERRGEVLLDRLGKVPDRRRARTRDSGVLVERTDRCDLGGGGSVWRF